MNRCVLTVISCTAALVVTAGLPGGLPAAAAEEPEEPSTPAPFVPATPTPSNAELVGMSHGELARALVRCQQLDGETYCLQVGFTDEDVTSAEFWQDIERSANEPSSFAGAMSLRDRLDQLAAMTAADRQDAEDAEITDAAQAVGSFKLLEYRSLGQEPPGGFWADYPDLKADDDEARLEGGAARWAAAMDPHDPPVEYKIMPDGTARRQVRSYYCGPATMQMIDGGDPRDDAFDSQLSWDRDLGTTTNGTWIGALRQQINVKTAWDRRGGKYKLVRVRGWSNGRFWGAITHQIGFLGAPYVTHPKLHSNTHPYLSTQGGYGGHFQPGRGYQRTSDGRRFVMIFEPFNEPDWTSYTKRTWGLRHVSIGNALTADQRNQGNIAI